MAGRPLTGRVKELASGRWEASVPERRGSRRRIQGTFATRQAADGWVAASIVELLAGRSASTPPPTVDTHWLTDAAEAWFDARYRQAQRGGPNRAAAVRAHLELRVLPFFTSRWATPTDVALEDCEEFMLHLAGRCRADGTSVIGTNEQLPAVSQRYASGVRATLEAVLAHAQARRIIEHNPATVVHTSKPLGTAKIRNSPGRRGQRMLTLAEVHRLARGLHQIHQMALWLQRLVGLRVGEVYGIRVGDIVHDGDYGVVFINCQGGRRFERWAANGALISASHVDQTKNRQSMRIVVIPPILMCLIERFIAAFHTAADGTVDLDARLVPAIGHAEAGGIGAYTTALGVAAGKEIVEDAVCSHDLRKSLCTDLRWNTDLDQVIQRRLVGHAAGNDIHDRVYVLDHPDLAGLREAADEIERLVRNTVEDVMVPTVRFPAFYRTNHLAARSASIRSACVEMGWLVENRDSMSVVAVADLLGRSDTQARRLIQHGLILGRKTSGSSGTEWRVDRTDIDAFLNRYRDLMTIDEAAEALGLDYHRAFHLQRRLKLDVQLDEATRRLILEQRHLDAMRAELARIEALHLRSMTVTQTARVLGRRETTVRGWIEHHLTADPETDSSGVRFVTRDTVEACQKQLLEQQRQRRRNLPGRSDLDVVGSVAGLAEPTEMSANETRRSRSAVGSVDSVPSSHDTP
jgi:hypothetical protein